MVTKKISKKCNHGGFVTMAGYFAIMDIFPNLPCHMLSDALKNKINASNNPIPEFENWESPE